MSPCLQETDVKPGKYWITVVSERGYKVGERVSFVDDNTSDARHDHIKDLNRRSDTMVKCYRMRKHNLYYVTV